MRAWEWDALAYARSRTCRTIDVVAGVLIVLYIVYIRDDTLLRTVLLTATLMLAWQTLHLVVVVVVAKARIRRGAARERERQAADIAWHDCL